MHSAKHSYIDVFANGSILTVYDRISGTINQIFFQKINSNGDFEGNDSQVSNATRKFLFIFYLKYYFLKSLLSQSFLQFWL